MPIGKYKRTEYHRKRLSDSHIGKNTWSKNLIHSEETKKKISDARKGRKPMLGKKHSKVTKEKMSLVHLKKGIKIRNATIRGRREYKKWRMLVYLRDNFTCQICRKRGVYLEAHHIKSFYCFPKLRYKLDNGVTLCRECHGYIHKIIKVK